MGEKITKLWGERERGEERERDRERGKERDKGRERGRERGRHRERERERERGRQRERQREQVRVQLHPRCTVKVNYLPCDMYVYPHRHLFRPQTCRSDLVLEISALPARTAGKVCNQLHPATL